MFFNREPNNVIKYREVRNKYNFQKLSSVNDADITVYEDAIDFVFENSDIKNVAISGAYSSGKSSILESYKAKHTDKCFVHLSLAHFQTSEKESIESSNNDQTSTKASEPKVIKESVLEGKILNQLIHQIPADKIPQTNFRVKKGINQKSLVWLTVFVSLFIACVALILASTEITTFITQSQHNLIKNGLAPLASQYTIILAILIAGICCIQFTYTIIKAQKTKNVFKKISLKGTDIEILGESNDSYFDKYLNEVLYLFEKIEAQVIVFEDMDRFNASPIFERLREVNTLVNVQRKKDKGIDYIPLRFFYLLRDDIFVSKDRTKFFDYIVPIVPYVDSSNSYEQFLELLQEEDLLDKFNLSFLQSLSLYVDDMRILKNIYNEFVIYFNRLNITGLDYNKMMAMITYKNLFPRDFSDLQLAKGFIHEVFFRKQYLVEETLKSINNQKKEMVERIDATKKEVLTTQQELVDVYAAKNTRLPKNYGSLTLEGINLQKQYASEMPIRQQAIRDINEGNIPQLESELYVIERIIAQTSTKSLSELITRDNVDKIFTVCHINEIGEKNDFNEIKRSDYFELLKYLIRNGFIDETFADYMTYFYGNSISAIDKTFLRRITDRRGAEYTYALKEPDKVVESPILREAEFGQEETLNFDLLGCLLQNNSNPEYVLYLKKLISQIKETQNFDFFSKFYEVGKNHQQFVVNINKQWASMFSTAMQNRLLPTQQIRQYSIETLYYCDNETIMGVNVDDSLTRYISGENDYLRIENPDILKLISGFKLIGVLFAGIQYDNANKSLFEAVYQNNMYELNFDNISLMLNKMYRIDSIEDIVHKNYTLIHVNEDSPLAKYVAENIMTYIEVLLENCMGSISDDESIVKHVLNNTKVNSVVKEQYIGRLSTTISAISEIADSALWKVLIENGRVQFSMNNFANYFIEFKLDSTLVNFINSETEELDFSSMADTFSKVVSGEIFNSIARCNEVDTLKYKKVLNDLCFYFDDYEANEINDEKFQILISDEIIMMNVESLVYVREEYSKHIYLFIQYNLDAYLALQSAELFQLDEVTHILNWDFEDNAKTQLISLTNEPISIVGKVYTDAVNAYIVTNNLNNMEKPFLFENYSEYEAQTKTAISVLAFASINEIIAENIIINDELLSILFKTIGITQDQKISLLTLSIPSLNEETCKLHFDELGLTALNGIFTKSSGRRNYEKNKDVTTVLEALKVHGWIHEYYDDERNTDKYIVVKKPR